MQVSVSLPSDAEWGDCPLYNTAPQDTVAAQIKERQLSMPDEDELCLELLEWFKRQIDQASTLDSRDRCTQCAAVDVQPRSSVRE